MPATIVGAQASVFRCKETIPSGGLPAVFRIRCSLAVCYIMHMHMAKQSTVHKVIYFVRHGESEANIAPVFQSPESPLSERGRHQAQMIAGRVSQGAFDALISSPFARARETAHAIAQATEADVEYSDLFVERLKPSSINGKPFTDEAASAIWAPEKFLSRRGAASKTEKTSTTWLRAPDRALSSLEGRRQDALLVVTHGYFLRTVIARMVMRDALTGAIHRAFQSSFVSQNTGITVIRLESNQLEPVPRWRLSLSTISALW